MSLSLNCNACQRSISVADSYAGKTIRCPTCRSAVQVPQQQAAASHDRIPIQCTSCQKSFLIGPQHAGLRIACPECRKAIVVPSVTGSRDQTSAVPKTPRNTRQHDEGRAQQRSSSRSSKPRQTRQQPPSSRRGNHATQNDGQWLDDVSSYNSPALNDSEVESYHALPPRAKTDRQTAIPNEVPLAREPKKKRQSRRWKVTSYDLSFIIGSSTLFFILVVGAFIFATSIKLDITKTHLLYIFSFAAMFAVYLAAQLVLCFSAFSEGPIEGFVYLIIGLYRPFFAFTRIERHPTTSTGYLLFLLGGTIVGIFLHLHGDI